MRRSCLAQLNLRSCTPPRLMNFGVHSAKYPVQPSSRSRRQETIHAVLDGDLPEGERSRESPAFFPFPGGNESRCRLRGSYAVSEKSQEKFTRGASGRARTGRYARAPASLSRHYPSISQGDGCSNPSRSHPRKERRVSRTVAFQTQAPRATSAFVPPPLATTRCSAPNRNKQKRRGKEKKNGAEGNPFSASPRLGKESNDSAAVRLD